LNFSSLHMVAGHEYAERPLTINILDEFVAPLPSVCNERAHGSL